MIEKNETEGHQFILASFSNCFDLFGGVGFVHLIPSLVRVSVTIYIVYIKLLLFLFF